MADDTGMAESREQEGPGIGQGTPVNPAAAAVIIAIPIIGAVVTSVWLLRHRT